MIRSGLEMVRASLWEVPPDFRCRKPEYAERLDINAAYDQQHGIGHLYWAIAIAPRRLLSGSSRLPFATATPPR